MEKRKRVPMVGDYVNISPFYQKIINELCEEYPLLMDKKRRTYGIIAEIVDLINSFVDENIFRKVTFISAIIVSAQDDFLDDINVKIQKKKDFMEVLESIFSLQDNPYHQNCIEYELIKIWKDVMIKVSNSKSYIKIVKSFNSQMGDEINEKKYKNLNEYIKLSSASVGASFVLGTYLHYSKKILLQTNKINSDFFVIDSLARLINDIGTSGNDKKEDSLTVIERSGENIELINNYIFAKTSYMSKVITYDEKRIILSYGLNLISNLKKMYLYEEKYGDFRKIFQ